MSRKLKSLQDLAAAVAARLGELTALEDRSAEQDTDLDHLIAEADEVRAAIVREEKIVAKEEELRAVVDPASPAKPDPEVAAPVAAEVREVKEEAITLTKPATAPAVAVAGAGGGTSFQPFPFISIIGLLWFMSLFRRRRAH